MCLNIGIPKSINFPFGTNGKLMLLGVPIQKLCRVFHFNCMFICQFKIIVRAMNTLRREVILA